MSAKIAFVGSRSWNDERPIRLLLESFPKNTIIVSGGARGVDSIAERIAKELGLEVVIFVPDWETYGKAAGPIRNTKIINEADMVFAFWDGKSTGTMDSINKARQQGKLERIFRLPNYEGW